MKAELTYGDLLCIYCCLFRTISDIKEAKKLDHQRYGEKYDERHERTIQACTELAGRIHDMLEEGDLNDDRTESV